MNWWVVGALALFGVGTAAVLSSVSKDERDARERWATKHSEAERSVEEHILNIESHLRDAQSSYDFHFLTNLHFSSLRVADNAYGLLRDARTSLATMYQILDKITEQKNVQKSTLPTANFKEKKEIFSEISDLNKFKSSVLGDLAKVKPQKAHLFSEVKRLNEQTHSLKIAIRDRCGERGRDWFARLEARSLSRRGGASYA